MAAMDLNNKRDDQREGKVESKESRVARRREEMSSKQDELMNKGKRKDFVRRLLTERDEAEKEEALIRAEEARDLRHLQVEQARKLAEELRRRKDEEIREQKLRQLLRNDSVELRQLEDELRQAYAARAIETQLCQQQFRKNSSKIKQIRDDRAIEAWYRGQDKKNEEESQEKKEQYRRDLQAQIAFKKTQRCQQKMEERMLECAMLEKPRGLLAVGNHEGSEKQAKRVARLLEEQRAFLEAQKARKLRELEEMLREDELRERILTEKRIQQSQREDAKMARFAAQDAIVKKIMEKVEREEKRRREREEVTKELMEEEERFALENRSREEAAKKIQRIKETQEEMENQKILRAQIKAREEKIDRKFYEHLVKEREEFEKEQQRKDCERRATGAELHESQKNANELARLRYVQYILENQADLRKNQQMEKERQEAIEKERLRMLEEHGGQLHGFSC